MASWFYRFFHLNQALSKQKEAIQREAILQDQQSEAKKEVIKQTSEVEDRLNRLRKQTEVIRREFPDLKLPNV